MRSFHTYDPCRRIGPAAAAAVALALAVAACSASPTGQPPSSTDAPAPDAGPSTAPERDAATVDGSGSFGSGTGSGAQKQCSTDAECADGNPCTSAHCALSTEFGTCEYAPVPNGTICGGDAGACMEMTCKAGVCTAMAASGGDASPASGKCVRFEGCVDMLDHVTVSCGGPLVVTHLEGSLIGEHPNCAGVVSTVNPSVSLYDASNGVFAIDGVAYPLSATPAVGISQLLNFAEVQARGTVTRYSTDTVELNDVPQGGPALYVVDLCD